MSTTKRRGPKFAEANVPVPEKWAYFAFEYRIGFDAGLRFKKFFPAPGADTWRDQARNAFRAGWRAARKIAVVSETRERDTELSNSGSVTADDGAWMTVGQLKNSQGADAQSAGDGEP